MNKKLLITIMMYLLLLLGCFAIVHIVERLTGGTSIGESSETPIEVSTESDYSPEAEEESTETITQPSEEQTVSQKPKQTWYPYTPVLPEPEEVTEAEPPTVMLATDIHYMSSKTTDYGEAFDVFTSKDDGKVLRYSEELTDALLAEVLEAKPNALVLSGDITVNGEKINHQELAVRLRTFQESGIQVLVIPGNHDINNPHASTYFGTEKKSADQVTPEEFYEIYREFGYDQSISMDENSLSYLYPLDEKNWLMMLDSCQYIPRNLVGGKIEPATYDWMEDQFEKAEEAGVSILPIAHHNLLKESRVYTTECDIEGGERLVAMLEKWKVPLFLSGHLHLQRVKKFYSQPGVPKDTKSVYEVVTGSTAIAPCEYAVIKWSEDGELNYRKKAIDVSAWAVKQGRTDENLLVFDEYSVSFLEEVYNKQTFDQLANLQHEQKTVMSELFGKLNRAYCAGEKVEKYQIVNDDAYFLWERNRPESSSFQKINEMMYDLQSDFRSWDSKTAE